MRKQESGLAGVRKALQMEERRLKNILSHLSPGLGALPCNSGTCNILNGKSNPGVGEDGIGDKWNLPITVLDDLRLPPHCAQNLHLQEGCRDVRYAGHRPEARSSSDLCDDRPSGPKENLTGEKKMLSSSNIGADGTDVRFKQTGGRIQQNSFMPGSCSTSAGPITGNALPCAPQLVNEFPSFVDCSSVSNELTIQRCRGVLRPSLGVGDFEYQFQGRKRGACTSGTQELYGRVIGEANVPRDDRNLTCLANLKLETEQLAGSNRNEPAVEAQTLAPHIFMEAQASLNREYNLKNVVDVTHLEARVREKSIGSPPTVQRAEDKKDIEGLHAERGEMSRESSCEGTVNQHKATMNNHQGDAVTRGIFKSPDKQDQQTAGFRSSRFNLESVDFRSEAGGSTNLSRNNARTGQRRSLAEDCIFCHIVQGRSSAFKLYEDEMCICILDMHPLSHGHSLIIPKAHFRSLELTPPEVAAAMCAAVPIISSAIMEATTCDSFNLLVNSGTAAGQVIFHTHFHIIPRRLGDNLWRSEGSGKRPLPIGHETSLLVQQIRHKLSGKHV